MTTPPLHPRIYHITHVKNLASIVKHGALWSDAQCLEQGLGHTSVGISDIKRRRLTELPVRCHPGMNVGEFVPFYFCPRSIMLFLLHKANTPGLDYQGGQQPILHLEADLRQTTAWADARDVRWAFTKCNAGARYVHFYRSLAQLDQIDWDAVCSIDFRSPVVKEGKQAEFLIHRSFPLNLVRKIGVFSEEIAGQVTEILNVSRHQPTVSVESEWYF